MVLFSHRLLRCALAVMMTLAVTSSQVDAKSRSKKIARHRAEATSTNAQTPVPKTSVDALINRFSWGMYLIQYEHLWQSLDLQHYGCLLLHGISFKAGMLDNTQVQASNSLAKKIAVTQPCVLPMVILSDAEQFNQLFYQPNLWLKLQQSLLDLLKNAPYQGIHLQLDLYQPITETAQQGFRVFVQQLATKLHQQHKILTIYTTAHAQHTIFSASLMTSIDRLILQGHDATWQNSPATGPIAPLRGSYYVTWEKTLKEYTDLGVPNQKIMFTIPTYGYTWQAASDQPGAFTHSAATRYPLNNLPKPWNTQRSITQQRQKAQLLTDAGQGGIFFITRQDKKIMQTWFDDEQATRDKLNYIYHQGLKGAVIYPLGFDGGAFNHLLSTYTQPATKPNPLTK